MSTNVFALIDSDGRPLPPAVQATVLAKYSRSPLSALELIRGLTAEQAEAFQEKYDVTWGHSSVGELSTIPYCFEGVSIIASKFLERYQRAAYSEKSTRYQEFSEESWIEPPGAPAGLRDIASKLYKTYKELEAPVFEYIEKKFPPGTPKPVIKARAFDNLRYLLPAGTGTNLAAVLNARDARYMMCDLLGSELPELRAIGEQMVGAARAVAPVFALGVKPNTFELKIRSLGTLNWPLKHERSWAQTGPSVAAPEVYSGDVYPWVLPRGEWRWSNNFDVQSVFWRNVAERHGLDEEDFSKHMANRGKHPVPEIFKTVPIGFEVMMDYGAFRDLQRHRRCEQYVEPLSLKYGYTIPDDFIDSPFQADYERAIQGCVSALRKLYENPVFGNELDDPVLNDHSAQYAIPLATLHRSIFQMDLRELYYIAELRTAPQGHISYRRIAWAMYQIAKMYYQELMRWCRAIEPTAIGAHT